MLAAAFALVAALGASVVAQQAAAPTAAPVIRAKMNALPRWAGSTGEAAVETDVAGNRFLVVSLSTPEKIPGEQGYFGLALWLWLMGLGVWQMERIRWRFAKRDGGRESW